MIEDTGDLWTYTADAVVITTNGYVKKNGQAVMGKGCAAEAANKWPFLPALLGEAIENFGNEVFIWTLQDIDEDDELRNNNIITMPVKYNWWEPADLDLIQKSAVDLKTEADLWHFDTVVMPRPGCGNGGLEWEEVKPVVDEILDDRFVAITYGD
jgi:hypothetical protein